MNIIIEPWCNRASHIIQVSYHTSIILALIALTGALAVRSDSFVNFLVITPLGGLVSYISYQSISAIERLYDHFIEAIRTREEIEIKLGIRDISKTRKNRNEKPRVLNSKDGTGRYWEYDDELLYDSWIPSNKTGGYFIRTQNTFNTFFIIGMLMSLGTIVLACVMASLEKYV